MNILMILDGEFPPDDRVEKEAILLIREGNKVSLLCLNYGSFKETEDYKGISISRLKINRTFRNKIMASYLVLPFYRMFWEKNIRRYTRENPTDIIHIHDLPLTDIAVRMREAGNVKVVCDQHEYYSNWIVNTAHYNTFGGRIVRFLSNWASYERKNLTKADLVITVEEPLREIYISRVGLDPNRVVALPNTPVAEIFNPEKTDSKINQKYSDKFVVFYAGSVDILRGINTIIESLQYLRDSIPNLMFVCAGRFRGKYYNPVGYSEKLGVADMTDFPGWIPHSTLPYYISASNVCLHVPPSISLEVNNSIATKIYQYVLMNKPLIVGQARMMKDFVEVNRIGLSIRESDPRDLAEKIKLMYSSPALVSEFVTNTKKIAPRYSWEETSKQFLEQYKKLIS